MPRLLLIALFASSLGAQADPAALSRQGKQAMAAGRFAEAIGVYEQLVEQIPNNPGLLLNLGMALHMTGQDKQAIPRLEQALAIAPDLFPALLFSSAGYLRLGQTQQALEPLGKALELQPKDAQLLRMLADAYTQLGRLREALPHRIELTKLAPNDPGVWAGLVQTSEALAGDAFQALDQQAPESAWMLRLVGDLRASQQQFPSAFYLYQEALQRDPKMRGLHARLELIYQATGRTDWARLEAERESAAPAADCAKARLECAVAAGKLQLAAQAETSTPEEHYWRAKAASMLASEAFVRLESLPESVARQELLASILAEQGRHSESAAAWRTALKLAPDNAVYAQELATRLYFARELDEALPLLKSLAEKHPNEARWSFLLGDSHLQQQRVEQAIPLLERAVRQAPELMPARHALGRAYMQAGEAEKAIPHLETALKIDVDGALHYQLAQAYIRTGRREEAAAPLAKYRELQQTQQAQLEAAQKMEITAPAP